MNSVAKKTVHRLPHIRISVAINTFTARLEYDADGNLIKESSCTKEAVYAYNAANRMAESHITEIRGGSRQTPKDTVYSYDSFGRRILEADILNRWVRHTEYRGLSMDVWKNAAVHGIKEPRDSRGIDSTGMVFRGMQDFLPAFADFSRASPYDFTHVALTLPLTAGGEVLGLLQTEHSGIGFNPFVNASHTDAERHYFGKDHLGSVRAVTNQWGSPLYTFDYDVFGQPLQDRPERFRHGFTGKEYDSWTGLYNYGFRDYSAMFGRFTSVDPIQDGHNWYAYVNSDPVSWLDPWGLCPQDAESGEDQKKNAEKVQYYVYRDTRSYEISSDRNSPKNTYLDTAFLYNTETGESVAFHKVQTVANYPSTDGNNKPVDSCYLDTIKAGRFDLKLYTETNVAAGKAGIITNAWTIDGRWVDENGITENGKSPGRGLEHSNTKPDGSRDYSVPYSKQCFIMPGEDNTRFFETLERWGVEDGESIEGHLVDVTIYSFGEEE